ncbi:hypothetical protein SBRCBS47491_009293 [Sporothrix bragantina]|uniref:Alpha/beta hydrolase fold-3 domain-containing protein n=1 Tax=Sporothrix bragantina TaxID=671064 RepID=A0ABP0CTL9_9PEZI
MDFSQYGTPNPEWEAFVKTKPPAGQPGRVPLGLTPEQIQAQTNAAREDASASLCAAHGLDGMIHFKDHICPTRDGSAVTVRAYRPKYTGPKPLPTLVYFHGGGYLFGSLGSERFLCSSLAAKIGILVLHICYRHTPAFAHPTAHHDGHDGMQWIASHGDVLGMDTTNVVVGGLSAGAAVAASAVLDTLTRSAGPQDRLHIRALILGIPWILQKDAFPFHLFARLKTQRIRY